MSKPKTVILTLPLGGNYGGMLQAYALQSYLRQIGVDAETTHIREFPFHEKLLRRGYYTAKRIIHAIKPSPKTLTPDLDRHRNAKTQDFINRYISLMDGRELYRSKQGNDISAIVVGSDQVWRKRYVSIPTYLLAFTKDWDVTRISYAASFGKDDLSEYGSDLIEQSAELAKKFNAISVREDSAVTLVNELWGSQAEHHVDPTMLLDIHHYRKLIDENEAQLRESSGNLFAYVLDRSTTTAGIVARAADHLGLEPFNLVPPVPQSRREFFSNLHTYQLPPTPQWLKSFSDADFVVTDSFHGTVFALLFHKPFLVVGNRRRGLARFTSLLTMFGLEDRMVDNADVVNDELLTKPIDWERVDRILDHERERAHEYLTQNLLP